MLPARCGSPAGDLPRRIGGRVRTESVVSCSWLEPFTGMRERSMIFVSYAREDKPQVETLVAALEKRFEVFWDPDLHIGQPWPDEIQRELKIAKWVLVLWSEASVRSRYVREEAQVGLDAGKLVPMRFEEVEPPFGFRFLQSCDLFGWDGDVEDPAFLRLVEALEGHPTSPPPPPPWYARWWRARRHFARSPAMRAAAASLLVVGVAWGLITPPHQKVPEVAPSGVPRQEERPPAAPPPPTISTTLPASVNPIPSPAPAASSVSPPAPVAPSPTATPKHCCDRLTGSDVTCGKLRCADCGLKDCPKKP